MTQLHQPKEIVQALMPFLGKENKSVPNSVSVEHKQRPFYLLGARKKYVE